MPARKARHPAQLVMMVTNVYNQLLIQSLVLQGHMPKLEVWAVQIVLRARIRLLVLFPVPNVKKVSIVQIQLAHQFLVPRVSIQN